MLSAAEIGDDHIRSLVRRGALTRVMRSVYVVGADAVSHDQLRQASLLLAGTGAHLAGRSAAETHELLRTRHGSVCVARTARRARPLRLLRTVINVKETGRRGEIKLLTLPARDANWEVVNGAAAEPPCRALGRLAIDPERALLPRAWREADFRGLLLAPAIELEIARRLPGHERLQALLVDQPPKPADAAFRSRMELRLHAAFRRAGLPEPEVNQLREVGGRLLEFDFFFVDEQLVVEADGPHHRLPTRAAEDAERDRHARDHGLEVQRLSDEEIDRDADACARAVDVTLGERRQRLRPGR